MTMPGKRALNLGAFLICAGLMAYALYAEHQLMLEPCPLCSMQRLAVILLGFVFFVAGLHNTDGPMRYLYSALVLVVTIYGVIVAGRHVYLQNLPADQVPACGPGLDYMLETMPFREVLGKVFHGSGECADIDWQFLGLSMPAWVLAWLLVLGAFGIWNNLRRT
jgi:disulfide bond formation protein DsbB